MSKKTRVAINGFGRIGRVTAKYMLDDSSIELVAINDLTDTKTLAHLFKYDSVHGRFKGTVLPGENTLILNGKTVHCFAQKDPTKLDWKKLEIDVVIESTGHLTDTEGAMKHVEAGAKKVIISAPAKSDEIKAVVLGVNEHILDGTEKVISNASCTTNCAAPMIKIIDELCGIESCYVSTIHSYTNDQRIHDAPHSDLRRARAAALSIIPTTTGAAKAITKIFPQLHGKVGGCGIRVPVPDGSLTDITFIVNRHDVTVEEINARFKAEAEGKLKGILGYTDEPVVGIDCVGQTESCVIDAALTSVIGDMVKIVGWYDNESGYSKRLVDLVKYISK
ncbi:MAG TPA: type I glyceraldehyde-3-phosphate dehydrogenase [Flavobacteriales bacterium]|nr:type I glyceraldehyde-3-phosphate dehydrogenase [Flavobacteriales bacterium]